MKTKALAAVQTGYHSRARGQLQLGRNCPDAGMPLKALDFLQVNNMYLADGQLNADGLQIRGQKC